MPTVIEENEFFTILGLTDALDVTPQTVRKNIETWQKQKGKVLGDLHQCLRITWGGVQIT